MTGKLIGAEEAERIGLANRVAPADGLDAAVHAARGRAAGLRAARGRAGQAGAGRLGAARALDDARARGRRPGALRGVGRLRRGRPRVRREAPAAVQRLARPVDRARGEQVRAERAAEQRLRGARGLEQRAEVDARVGAHLVQHRDDVLGGDVAGRARRDRAAAELAEARLERAHARLVGGEHVRQALAARVVEVRRELDVVAERRAGGREEAAHLRRVGHPGRVAEADLLRAGRDQPLARSRTRARAGRGPRRGSRRRRRSRPRSAAPPRGRGRARAPARRATPRSSG